MVSLSWVCFYFFSCFFFFFVCIQNYLKTSVTAPKQFTSKPEFIEQSRFLKFTTTSILHCTRTVDSRCILRVHLQNGTPYVYTRAETENLISINRHILLAVTCIQTYITLVRVRGTRYTHTHTLEFTIIHKRAVSVYQEASATRRDECWTSSSMYIYIIYCKVLQLLLLLVSRPPGDIYRKTKRVYFFLSFDRFSPCSWPGRTASYNMLMMTVVIRSAEVHSQRMSVFYFFFILFFVRLQTMTSKYRNPISKRFN